MAWVNPASPPLVLGAIHLPLVAVLRLQQQPFRLASAVIRQRSRRVRLRIENEYPKVQKAVIEKRTHVGDFKGLNGYFCSHDEDNGKACPGGFRSGTSPKLWGMENYLWTSRKASLESLGERAKMSEKGFLADQLQGTVDLSSRGTTAGARGC